MSSGACLFLLLFKLVATFSDSSAACFHFIWSLFLVVTNNCCCVSHFKFFQIYSIMYGNVLYRWYYYNCIK